MEQAEGSDSYNSQRDGKYVQSEAHLKTQCIQYQPINLYESTALISYLGSVVPLLCQVVIKHSFGKDNR